MMRPTVIASVAATVVAVVALFVIKYGVQNLEDEIAALEREKERHNQAIQVLRAEWSYLNRPDRIARLADRHLDLVPIESNQIATPPGHANRADGGLGGEPW